MEPVLDQWYVYIVRCRGNTLYTGITNDLKKRIELHNQGKGAKYTRGRGPVALVYHEIVNSKSEALKREAFIKSLRLVDKQKLIQGCEIDE